MRQEKILFEDSRAIDNMKDNLEYELQRLRELQAQFNKLGLSSPLSGELIRQMKNGNLEAIIRGLFRDLLPERDEHTNLPFDKEKWLNLTAIPSLRPLKEAIDRIHSDMIQFVKFTPEIELNEERVETYLDKFRIYASSPEVEKLHDALKRLEANLNEVDSLARFVVVDERSHSVVFDLGTVFSWQEKSGFIIKMEAFKALLPKIKAFVNN
jgi:hypothetical protein